MKNMDHDRCSESLPALLDGSLGRDDAAEVRAHLATCEECRTELRGLEAMRDLSVEGGLTTGERAALERGVMAGISQEPGDPVVVPFASRRRVGLKVAGALGAAATVAVIATMAYFGSSGGLDTVGGGDAGTAESNEEAGGGGGRIRDRKESRVANKGGVEDVAMGAQEEADQSQAVAGTGSGVPRATFTVERRALTGADLQKRGESGLPSVSLAATYSADDARGGRTLLEGLVDSARAAAGDEVADQVEECGTQVLETSDPTIPSFGTLATLEGREVVVLGFVWTRADSGPLDRYMVWAWERGSCDIAVDFVEGKIETAN